MKRQDGITLISLIIYIIALLVVMSVIIVLTGYFYKNVNIDSQASNFMTQYTKFNSYFANEINEKDIKVVESETADDGSTSYISFSNKNTYTFSSKNKAIYFNEVEICRNVDKCIFSVVEENEVCKITVDFQAGDFERNITYTINN